MAILDFAGSGALQAVSECPQHHKALIFHNFFRFIRTVYDTQSERPGLTVFIQQLISKKTKY